MTPAGRRGENAAPQVWPPSWDTALRRRLTGMAKRMSLGGSRAAREDLVLETIYRIWQRHATVAPFPSVDDAARWGTTVLHNLAANLAAHHRRHPTISTDVVPEEQLGLAPSTPAEADRRTVGRLFAGLKPIEQAVLRASDIDNLSVKAGAKLLGLTVGQYKGHLERGRRSLRVRAKRHGLGAVVPVGCCRAMRDCVRSLIATSLTSAISVSLLIVGPMSAIVLPLRPLGRGPALPSAAALLDAAVAQGGGIPRAPVAGLGRVGRPPAHALNLDAGSAPDVEACAPGAGCGGVNDETPAPAPGQDTLYVTVPSVAGNPPHTAYFKRDAIPFCQDLPQTQLAGCKLGEPSPTPAP